jgi:hypothetical protein
MARDDRMIVHYELRNKQKGAVVVYCKVPGPPGLQSEVCQSRHTIEIATSPIRLGTKNNCAGEDQQQFTRLVLTGLNIQCNYGTTNAAPAQKDRPLPSSKRRLHF